VLELRCKKSFLWLATLAWITPRRSWAFLPVSYTHLDVYKRQVTRRVAEAEDEGATEVCLQGGIHPKFDGDYYIDVIRAVRAGSERIHIHAFTALEVTEGARRSGVPLIEYLATLKEAGLKTLPGTAAEILDDEVRAVLCPDKVNTEEWLEAHRCAHAVGLRSNVTIMFGSIEQPRSWARHMIVTRNLQRETGGFTEFVPLPFVHMATPIYLQKRSRRGPTFREALLMHAVGRIAYRGAIDTVSYTHLDVYKRQAPRRRRPAGRPRGRARDPLARRPGGVGRARRVKTAPGVDHHALVTADLDELTAAARAVRDEHHGNRVTFSPKVFIPLTMLCRDRCGYCTFAKPPARLERPYLTRDDVLRIAESGRAAGCHEALFTLGERPELRYPAAAEWLAEQGYASTVDYLVAMCAAVVEETGPVSYTHLHTSSVVPGRSRNRSDTRSASSVGVRSLGGVFTRSRAKDTASAAITPRRTDSRTVSASVTTSSRSSARGDGLDR